MRKKLHDIIFGINSKAGRAFDVTLLIFILASLLIVMFESVPEWFRLYEAQLFYLDWIFTIVFSIEYLIRIWISEKPLKYIFSWWGIIDLVSIIPTFLELFVSGYTAIRAVRALRLLRVFRILKLPRFTRESQALAHSLKASYYKIMVFLFFVVMMMVLAGTLMYVIEGGEHGFESIPASIYWAIVTTTTVGYGDLVPTTGLGKMLSSVMMILGYVIIAVPTGLISVEMIKHKSNGKEDDLCDDCGHRNPNGSVYCNQCSNKMMNG
jgi:voltage-gated potassium channel